MLDEHGTQKFINWLPILYIFIGLLSIYLLTFSGVPISDDEHLYATVSQNLVVSGEFRADQLLGNQRIKGRYGNIGPIHPVIGSFVYRLVRWTNKLGAVQSLYFLSPIYTALTGAIIYAFGVLRNYSRKASLTAAMAFGLSTIAWPYTQTFYREPLVMFLFFLSYYVFSSLLEDKVGKKLQVPGWFLFGVVYFLAILVKIYFILLLPLFLYRIWSKRKTNFNIKSMSMVRVLTIILVVLILLGVIWWVLSLNEFSRFTFRFISNSIDKLFKQDLVQLLSLETLKHLTAMFFSPAKGFLIYSPVMLVSVIPLLSKRYRGKENLVIPIGSLVIFVLAQYYVYQDIWWNISWSTRFLLPLIPILITAGLPVIEAVLTDANKTGRILLFVGIGLGVVIQLGGAAVSDSGYLEYMYTQKQIPDLADTVWSIPLMPAHQHWQMAISSGEVNFAAQRNLWFSPIFISVILLILISLVIWSARNVYLLIWHPRKGGLHQRKWLVTSMVFYILVFVPVLMLIAYRTEPVYYASAKNLDSAVEFLSNEVDQGDLVIVDSYQKPTWYYLMNFGRLSVPWYALPEQTDNWRAAFEQIIHNEGSAKQTWILVEDREKYKENVLEYINGLGFTCTGVPFISNNRDSHYRVLNCESSID